MRLTDYIKKMVINYFIIFAVIVISITVLRQFLSPYRYVETREIFVYMICALAGDLPGLILYSPNEISEKEMRLRIIIHFVVLEAVILVLANVTGWVTGALNTTLLSLQIAVIYMVVRFLAWMDDKKSADKINERLKAMKYGPADGPEE
jgi:Protein of unknown function (DUF3021).